MLVFCSLKLRVAFSVAFLEIKMVLKYVMYQSHISQPGLYKRGPQEVPAPFYFLGGSSASSGRFEIVRVRVLKVPTCTRLI